MDFDTRVGCYGWIERDDLVLLAYACSPTGCSWTLPGGMELGETPERTVVRELAEETGYEVEIGRFLGVDNVFLPPAERVLPGDRYLQSLRLVYRAGIVGGEFKVERDGSTKDAGWFTPEQVADLDREPLVSVAMTLARAESTVAATYY